MCEWKTPQAPAVWLMFNGRGEDTGREVDREGEGEPGRHRLFFSSFSVRFSFVLSYVFLAGCSGALL